MTLENSKENIMGNFEDFLKMRNFLENNISQHPYAGLLRSV